MRTLRKVARATTARLHESATVGSTLDQAGPRRQSEHHLLTIPEKKWAPNPRFAGPPDPKGREVPQRTGGGGAGGAGCHGRGRGAWDEFGLGRFPQTVASARHLCHLTLHPVRVENGCMKISQLLQVVLVSSFVAVPGMAVASVGVDTPLSLCGGDKADKAEKAESTEKADDGDTTVKAEKKHEKKDSKEAKKEAAKDSA
jgi:hypothetical protein